MDATLVLGAMGAAALALIVLASVIAGRRQAKATPVVALIDTGTDDTLHFCQGCGHRHRKIWFNFLPDGRYTCTVCCRKDHPNASVISQPPDAP